MMMGLEIVIVALIVWAVVVATGRNPLGLGTRPASGQSAKETLDARLARGEISTEEYRNLRETLGANEGSAAST